MFYLQSTDFYFENIMNVLTNEGALGSGRNDSGIGQNPTANPFWETVRGT